MLQERGNDAKLFAQKQTPTSFHMQNSVDVMEFYVVVHLTSKINWALHKLLSPKTHQCSDVDLTWSLIITSIYA